MLYRLSCGEKKMRLYTKKKRVYPLRTNTLVFQLTAKIMAHTTTPIPYIVAAR